ncbi:MAG: dihydrolipoyl dehydrogenase [Immundisolibacteraceae bacterium]|nr:dihydrolipoyl dehydrogenase [Immundisolibacteraceae bacterium]
MAKSDLAQLATEVVVIGAGPGGYTAAFRAADLGKKVVLVERFPILGGVCLNVGCIPSKALLHVAKVVDEASESAAVGVSFGKPKIDLDQVRAGKQSVVNKLTGGLKGLAKQRKVTVVQGIGKFVNANELIVNGDDGDTRISFEHAVIACGSSPTKIPNFPYDDPRLMDSTGALELEEIPNKLLVIGGGYIGLEMASVYHGLGSAVSVVEFMPSLLPGADADLVKPLQKRLLGKLANIQLSTKVTGIKPQKNGLKVSFENSDGESSALFDRVLVSVGRRPNSAMFDAEKAGIKVNERGFVVVDKQMRTSVNNIFAIGDIAGDPMLAHKAVHEGKVAAEVISGMKSAFDPLAIPAVVFTDPEVAWAGVTEAEARQQGLKYGKGVFPWAANGRSLSLHRDEGMTKILFEQETNRVIGVGIVGPGAGDLIAEGVLAIEMGADAEDIGLTIHPHPTVSETMAMAAEVFEGTVTDIFVR